MEQPSPERDRRRACKRYDVDTDKFRQIVDETIEPVDNAGDASECSRRLLFRAVDNIQADLLLLLLRFARPEQELRAIDSRWLQALGLSCEPAGNALPDTPDKSVADENIVAQFGPKITDLLLTSRVIDNTGKESADAAEEVAPELLVPQPHPLDHRRRAHDQEVFEVELGQICHGPRDRVPIYVSAIRRPRHERVSSGVICRSSARNAGQWIGDSCARHVVGVGLDGD